MIQTVYRYFDYVTHIKEYITDSPFKTKYFLSKLEMPKATFYRKLRENTFTVGEVKVITEILFPEELLKMELQKSEEDILKGRVDTNENVKNRLTSKYFS